MVFFIIYAIGAAFAGVGGGYTIYRRHKKHQAEFGTSAERKTEKKAGLGRFGRLLSSRTKAEKGRAKHAKIISHDIAHREKDHEHAAKDTSHGRIIPLANAVENSVEHVVEDAAKAAEEIQQEDVPTTALEARFSGLIATIRTMVQELEEWTRNEEEEENNESWQYHKIGDLVERLEQLTEKNIDAHALVALGDLLQHIKKMIDGETSTYDMRIYNMKKLFDDHLSREVGLAESIIDAAKTEQHSFRQPQRKLERRDGISELKDFKKAIEALEIEIQELKTSGRNPDLLQSQSRKLQVFKSQESQIRALEHQMYASMKHTDTIYLEWRHTLVQLVETSRSMSFDYSKYSDLKHKMSDAESDVDKAKKMLDDAADGFKDAQDIYAICLSVARALQLFFSSATRVVEIHETVCTGYTAFVHDGLIFTRLSDEFLKLCQSIRKSERLIDDGIERILAILTVDSNDMGVKKDIATLIAELKQTDSEVAQFSKIDERLKQYSEKTEQDIAKINHEFSTLKAYDDRVLKVARDLSVHLGKMVGHITRRRRQLGTVDEKRAKELQATFGKENAAAGKAFEQAMNT